MGASVYRPEDPSLPLTKPSITLAQFIAQFIARFPGLNTHMHLELAQVVQLNPAQLAALNHRVAGAFCTWQADRCLA